MLEAFLGFEFILLTALSAVGGGTALAANFLKYAVVLEGRTALWRNVTRAGLWLCMALFLLWLVNLAIAQLWLGWVFVMDRVILVLPVLALPLSLAAWLSLAALKRKDIAADQLVYLVVPVHTVPVGFLLAVYMIAVDVPGAPTAAKAATYLGISAAALGILWMYHKRRIARLQTAGAGGMLARGVRMLALAAVSLVLAAAWFVYTLEASKLPGTLAMVSHDNVDFGGGPTFDHTMMHHDGAHDHLHHRDMVSVLDLAGPRTGVPDKRFTLTAEKKSITLSSGAVVEAWTFNGQTPGPSLIVRQGDLVEVELVNRNIEQGVTLHWHGVDVPNAEDGVAGMTQNAVLPGESHTYRFVVEETGSHWYHSHQLSSIQVQRGLFGALIILPEGHEPGDDELDVPIFAHDWPGAAALDTTDTVQSRLVEPGTEVRLRLGNSSSLTKPFTLNGADYRVAAIDGHDVHEPGVLNEHVLKLGGGGRYDVVFTMPETDVTLALHQRGGAAIVFSPDGQGTPRPLDEGELFDPTAYGSPSPSPYDSSASFDRSFTMLLDQIYFGHYNGRSGALWAINGEVFPDTPTFMVQEGDLVKMTIINRSFADHPMHLHGHHVHVLSKNGKPIQGSPLVLDTLLVEPGEYYEVAFRADNPGLWMNHCHNLAHAAVGMTMHLAYENVWTPFAIGDDTGNHPE